MRVPGVHVTQREFRQAQGDRIAAELDLDKLGLLILNHRDGIYWVIDGQHRLYALRKWFDAKDTVDCEVYEALTDAQSAEIFLGRDNRRAIDQFDRFHVACTAQRPRELDIKKTVDASKLKIARAKDDYTVGAVAALGKVYDRSGSVVLAQTLRTLRDAYHGDPDAFQADLILATGLVFNRFNGRTDEKALADRLSQVALREVAQRAEAERDRTGQTKAQCIAATIVDIYNRGKNGKAKDRLTDWWKGSNGGDRS